MQEKKHYQFFVIGGGSGGLSGSRAAASFGKTVGIADFVKPSPPGTSWGLGGCIPKKLFHHASLMGEAKADLEATGWNISTSAENKWEEVSERITDHVKSLNFGYRKSLVKQNIDYYNSLARFVGANEVQLKDGQGKIVHVTADRFLIATGGRPTYPEIPGAKEHSITSDDIFWLKQKPGKTLIVGASYIALECAGFLHGLGVDVTVMVRSILLRGFDQAIANKIGDFMEQSGIKFIRKAVPTAITKNSKGKKVVTYKQGEDEIEDMFDDVMFAIGRSADTQGLNLEVVGVKTQPNGKIVAEDDDSTAAKNIYAIGDVVAGRLELTPTAIQAGRLLANRLFNGGTQLMNYKYVPTTVFTPIEYGCVGWAQEEATEKFGAENIVTYGSAFKPLEWSINYERTSPAYAKLVVNKADNNRVIGLHYLGPNAGEITQGFAVAIRMGATKQDFDDTVGIHPTSAEQFTTMNAIAGSPEQQKTGC